MSLIYIDRFMTTLIICKWYYKCCWKEKDGVEEIWQIFRHTTQKKVYDFNARVKETEGHNTNYVNRTRYEWQKIDLCK